MLSLSKFPTFGDVAAEDDSVLDYFLSTNAVDKIDNNQAFLVLGRKGTGKTAIVRFLTEGRKGSLSAPLNLRGYPWAVHALRIDHGASEIEAYVSSWRYLIAIQLAQLVLSHPHSSASLSTPLLRQFLTDNYGGVNPKLSDVLRPKTLRLGKFSFQPAIMGNQLGIIDMERSKKDHQFGLELNALTSSIMDAVLIVSRDGNMGSLSILFDELDQGLSHLDDARQKMLVGLILAAREIRRECAAESVVVNPIVFLRTDLWEELDFSDKNKISQTLTLHLDWNSDNLQSLINNRLRVKLDPSANLDEIAAPELMRGSQTKWNHVLARTFLRPRDVIQFLNITLDACKSRKEEPSIIRNPDIVNSRSAYSAYLKAELDDEIHPHWEHWEEALQACSAISTITFERSDFEREYNIRKSANNEVSSDDALRLLHRFSVIGYERRSGYGGTSWSFQYIDPESGWDNASSRFKVHLGLKEYARLREDRQ